MTSPPNGPPGTLLVVDDNRVNRLLLGRSLEQLGHTVTFAENGREALESLRKHRVDLVLLDIEMPERDGYQVLAALGADPHLRDIPVVMTLTLKDGALTVKQDMAGGQFTQAGTGKKKG